ncbi:MAG: DUF4129 domain-containing protein [Acidimicrobiia bacterium]
MACCGRRSSPVAVAVAGAVAAVVLVLLTAMPGASASTGGFAGPAQGEPGPPADEIRRRADDIAGREFAQHESLLERALGWVGDRRPDVGPGGTAGSGPGFVGVALTLVILVVGLVLLWRILGRLGTVLDQRAEGPPAFVTESDRRRSEADWRALAEAAEGAGRLRQALRARYGELVAALVAMRALDTVPGRTSGEYRRRLAASVPGGADDFGAATELFETAWYGGKAPSPEAYDRFRTLAGRVRDATRAAGGALAAEDRDDGVGSDADVDRSGG